MAGKHKLACRSSRPRCCRHAMVEIDFGPHPPLRACWTEGGHGGPPRIGWRRTWVRPCCVSARGQAERLRQMRPFSST